MSIDGKTAPANRVGRIFSKLMTSKHHKLLHKIRSEVDAIIVGVETIIEDDPALTVREVEGVSPVRVVLDSSARTPLSAKILDTEEAPTIIAVTDDAPKTRVEALKRKHVELITLGSERVNLNKLMGELKKRGVDSVLVEGGGEVRWSFFKENLVDEFFVWIMPYIWGGKKSPTLVDGEGFLALEEAVPLNLESMKIIDDIFTMWFSVKRRK